MNKPHFDVKQEYDVLRTELADGKKYVFERPLLIFTFGAALFKFESSSVAYWPAIINGLLLFNFWFTINRLESMSRIIAYIQLILEDQRTDWHGWETSLRFYRKWIKEKELRVDEIDIKYPGIFDNLGFYPKIYYLHIVMSVIVMGAMVSLFYTDKEITCFTYVFGLITFLFLIGILFYAISKSPKNLQKRIEQQRIVWGEVFKNWNELSMETTKVVKIDKMPMHNFKWFGKSHQRNILTIE
jgi:hypothetical protein